MEDGSFEKQLTLCVNPHSTMFLFVQPFIMVKRFLCFAEQTTKYNLTTMSDLHSGSCDVLTIMDSYSLLKSDEPDSPIP
jgi:hypothetical protein